MGFSKLTWAVQGQQDDLQAYRARAAIMRADKVTFELINASKVLSSLIHTRNLNAQHYQLVKIKAYFNRQYRI